MRKWQVKAQAFRALSVLPFGAKMHFWMQRYVTRRLPRPEKQVKAIFDRARFLVEQYEAVSSKPIHQSRFFEFGAGRNLAVPLSFSAFGAMSFITVDIERLARIDLVDANADYVAKFSGIAQAAIASIADLKRFWRIDYRAPVDARTTGLPSNSIDGAVSVETLEHIPPNDILGILQELQRLMTSDGFAIMQIDYGDHYKGFDPTISSFNFLTYSDQEWQPYQSNFQFVNRLRHSEYLLLFERAGFEIIKAVPDRKPDILKRLAPQFQKFAHEDLFTLGALIVARPFKPALQ